MLGMAKNPVSSAAALQAAQPVAEALLGKAQLLRQLREALAAVQAQLAQQGQIGVIERNSHCSFV